MHAPRRSERSRLGGATNQFIANRLREAADVLEQQKANAFRVRAYRHASDCVAGLTDDLRDILEREGPEGLERLPAIGPRIAEAIRQMLTTGRWGQLDRLRGTLDPEKLLRIVPGVGRELARRMHGALHVDTLEALELAAHDGRLASVPGIGPRRADMIRAELATILSRPRSRRAATKEPSVDVLLDVDREYREKAAAGRLVQIAPRRFNRTGESWLPVLHTERGDWRFTALFSNTAPAHELKRTRDWVVLYFHADTEAEGQRTVVTEARGTLTGRRVIRGREVECRTYYGKLAEPLATPPTRGVPSEWWRGWGAAGDRLVAELLAAAPPESALLLQIRCHEMEASTVMKTTEMSATLKTLAQITPGAGPVISVYLDTRWSDEHQRERVRVFVKNESRKAAAMAAGKLEADLAWIEEQAEQLVTQTLYADARGVALFASQVRGLREAIPLAAACADAFHVAETPRLRPLIDALGEAPRAAVLFVDGERARFIALTEQKIEDEVVLETSDVVGHHRRGGWAMLLQSRYQRHIQEHRARHFEAVATALAAMVEERGLGAVVLAGEPRNLAVFRAHLPSTVAALISGTVAGAHYEPASALASRALELTRHVAASNQAGTVESVLVEAEGGGRAAASVDAVVEAINRGIVDRLYILRSWEEPGRLCPHCGALQRGSDTACRWCGKPTSPVSLGEAFVQRVISGDGAVESTREHAGLERAGGVAALLRYPPTLPSQVA
jgi:peptide subunit release factor 1 (eRF1)